MNIEVGKWYRCRNNVLAAPPKSRLFQNRTPRTDFNTREEMINEVDEMFANAKLNGGQFVFSAIDGDVIRMRLLDSRAIKRLCDVYDEFESTFDPECTLPETAERVHGIFSQLCELRNSLRQQLAASQEECERLKRELDSLKNPRKALPGNDLTDAVDPQWWCQ